MAAYYRGPVRRSGNVSIFWPLSLFFFVLSTICTGLWAYATMSDQKSAESAVKKETEKVQMLTNTKDFYAFVAAEERLILGMKLTDDEKAIWRTARAEFFKDKGKFDVVDPKLRKVYADLIEQAMTYQTFDEESGKYGAGDAKKEDKKGDDENNVFQAKLDDKDDQIRKLKAELKDKDKKLAEYAKFAKDNVSKQDQANRDNLKTLKDGYETAQREARQQSEATKEAFKRLSELVTELNEEKEKFDARELGWFAVLREKETKIKQMEADAVRAVPAAPGVPAEGAPRNRGGLQALDMSMGKALYDDPVGKIVSIAGNKVLIEVFADDRVDERLKLKTKLPFNVFAPARPDGKADRQLKATIEIVSVQKGRFAEARITARFNGDKNPIDEGDELFNPAWGTHVAVVGQCNLFGKVRGESQLEQARNLKGYLQRLEDQGAIIDAYVDMVDGSVKGQYGRITDKTRYLIVGNDLNEAKGVTAALSAVTDEATKEAIENAAKKRIGQINGQIVALKKDAADKGLFVISPENFAHMAGYRKIGGYGPDDIPFVPKLPVVGANPPAN